MSSGVNLVNMGESHAAIFGVNNENSWQPLAVVAENGEVRRSGKERERSRDCLAPPKLALLPLPALSLDVSPTQ